MLLKKFFNPEMIFYSSLFTFCLYVWLRKLLNLNFELNYEWFAAQYNNGQKIQNIQIWKILYKEDFLFFKKMKIKFKFQNLFSLQMVVKNHGNATWARGLFYNCWCIEAKTGCALPLCHVDFLISHIPYFIWLCGVLNTGKR